MDFRWNDWNVEHIGRHGVSALEAEAVVRNGRSLIRGDGKYLVIGRGSGGRWLQVIYVLDEDGTLFVIGTDEGKYGRIAAELRRLGRLIGQNDMANFDSVLLSRCNLPVGQNSGPPGKHEENQHGHWPSEVSALTGSDREIFMALATPPPRTQYAVPSYSVQAYPCPSVFIRGCN